MSDKTTPSNTTSISFLSLLAVAFIVLKLCNVIDWSWWWVTCPMWGFPALGVLLFIISAIGYFLRNGVEKHGTSFNKPEPPKSKWQERIKELQKNQAEMETKRKMRDN